MGLKGLNKENLYVKIKLLVIRVAWLGIPSSRRLTSGLHCNCTQNWTKNPHTFFLGNTFNSHTSLHKAGSCQSLAFSIYKVIS